MSTLTDRQSRTVALAGLATPLSSSVTNATSVAHQAEQRAARGILPTDASAANAQIIRLATFDRPVTVISARLAEGAAVASNSSNYVTYSLFYDADNQSGTVTVSASGGLNTSAAALASQSSAPIPLGTSVAVPSGAVLYVQTVKAGTGVSRTANGYVDVIYEENSST